MAIIVIDPGHGGTQKVGGSSPNNATTPSGLLEKALTLNVAEHAAATLVQRGHTVTLTRTTDVNLGLAERAAVAKAAGASAFVSIHFNGFSDPRVQGTETWVHHNASAASLSLAAQVQRAVLTATQYRDRGVQTNRLGVLDPDAHLAITSACLAELSFITTEEEDDRLHEPLYLAALGNAVAAGVDAFIAQITTAPMPRPPLTVVHRRRKAAATRPKGAARPTNAPFPAPALVPNGRIATIFTNPKVTNVLRAVGSIPPRGRHIELSGGIKERGGAYTHLQGLSAYRNVYFLTQSDQKEVAGRIIVADRATQSLLREFRLPVISTNPRYFHAGGSQLVGDVLAVPCESRENRSVVCFLDVSDPALIREFDPGLRVFNDCRDGAAVGITSVERDGREVWILATFDSGTVDIYQSLDLPGGLPFAKLFSTRIDEKDHQAFPLLTDSSHDVFALGINRGNWFHENVVVLYRVNITAGTITPFPNEKSCDFPFKARQGASLRWGSDIEVRSAADLALHCSSKHYTDCCDLNAFASELAAFKARGLRAASRKRLSSRPRKGVPAPLPGERRKRR